MPVTSRQSGSFHGAAAVCLGTMLLLAPAGHASPGDPATAALQLVLAQQGLYTGTIDGDLGVGTVAGLVAFQTSRHLTADGIVGPQTARALGRCRLGIRPLSRGTSGWDVAELQFRLAWHGFPSGAIDGRFGERLEQALRRFQRFAGLPVDGVAGGETVRALDIPPPRAPIRLQPPVDAPIGDVYGPRGDRFHAGVDFVAGFGTTVRAAAAGRVVWVGMRTGWGLLVTVAHGRGVRTLYAHLSAAYVAVGTRVAAGAPLGAVGATGDATGPHLHFEVRVDGAAVDPAQALAG